MKFSDTPNNYQMNIFPPANNSTAYLWQKAKPAPNPYNNMKYESIQISEDNFMVVPAFIIAHLATLKMKKETPNRQQEIADFFLKVMTIKSKGDTKEDEMVAFNE